MTSLTHLSLLLLLVHCSAQGHPSSSPSSFPFLYTKKLQLWSYLFLTITVCILVTFFWGRYLKSTPRRDDDDGGGQQPRKMTLKEAEEDGNEKMSCIWKDSGEDSGEAGKEAGLLLRRLIFEDVPRPLNIFYEKEIVMYNNVPHEILYTRHDLKQPVQLFGIESLQYDPQQTNSITHDVLGKGNKIVFLVKLIISDII